MRKFIFIGLLFFSSTCFSQTDTTKWFRAFPVTDYLIDLNDSTKLVQVELPDGITIKDKQLALLRGVYNTLKTDTAEKVMDAVTSSKAIFIISLFEIIKAMSP